MTGPVAPARHDGGTSPARAPEGITLPPGVGIEIYADDLPGARQMALGSDGTLFVGTRDEVVYAVTDRDGDGRADPARTLLKGLDTPNGVAFRAGSLLVSDDLAGAIYRIRYRPPPGRP